MVKGVSCRTVLEGQYTVPTKTRHKVFGQLNKYLKVNIQYQPMFLFKTQHQRDSCNKAHYA